MRDVFDQRLYIGDAISARDLTRIYDYEFAAVVDLAANEPPAVLGRDIIYCRFPLSDDDSNDDAIIAAAIQCVRELFERRFKVLVACSVGMSRSPVIAAAALSISKGEPFSDTLIRITSKIPHDVSPALVTSVQRVHARLIP